MKVRGFHSLLSKPVDLYASNMLIYSSVVRVTQESINFFALDAGLSWSMSVFVSAACLRLALTPVHAVLKRINWDGPTFVKDVLGHLHKTVLINDLADDVKRLV